MLYNLATHDNCIQFSQNYGERPSDYDQSFVSQKLKYRVKTPRRHNIASIASFKCLVFFRFVHNLIFFLHPKAFNPRTYTQIHTSTVVQGGEGVDGTPPRCFWYAAVFWNDFTFSEKPLIFLTRWGIFCGF